jgi:hypothetical protein
MNKKIYEKEQGTRIFDLRSQKTDGAIKPVKGL